MHARGTATPARRRLATAARSGKDCSKVEDFAGEPKVAPSDDVVEAPAYFHFYKSEQGPGKRLRF